MKDTYRKYINETREQIAGLTEEELELRKEFFAAYYSDSSPDRVFAWVMQKLSEQKKKAKLAEQMIRDVENNKEI